MDNQHKRESWGSESEDLGDSQIRNFSPHQYHRFSAGTPHLFKRDDMRPQGTSSLQSDPANITPQQLSSSQVQRRYTLDSRSFELPQVLPRLSDTGQPNVQRRSYSLSPQPHPFPNKTLRRRKSAPGVQRNPSLLSSDQSSVSPAQLSFLSAQAGTSPLPVPSQQVYYRQVGITLNHEFEGPINWTLRSPSNPYTPIGRQLQHPSLSSPPSPSPSAQLHSRTPFLLPEERYQDATSTSLGEFDDRHRKVVTSIIDGMSLDPELVSVVINSPVLLTIIYNEMVERKKAQKAKSPPATHEMREQSNLDSSQQDEHFVLKSEGSSTTSRRMSSASLFQQQNNSVTNFQLQYLGRQVTIAQSQSPQGNVPQPNFPFSRVTLANEQVISLVEEDYPVGRAIVVAVLEHHKLSFTPNNLREAMGVDIPVELQLKRALLHELGTEQPAEFRLQDPVRDNFVENNTWSQRSIPQIPQSANPFATPAYHIPVRQVEIDVPTMSLILHQFIYNLPQGQPNVFSQDIFMDTELFTKSLEVIKFVRVEESFMDRGHGWTENTLVSGKPKTYRDYAVFSSWQSIALPAGGNVRMFCTVYTKRFPKGLEFGKWENPASLLQSRKRQKVGENLLAVTNDLDSDSIVWEYSATAATDTSNLIVKCPVPTRSQNINGVEYEMEPDWDTVVDALKREVQHRGAQLRRPAGRVPTPEDQIQGTNLQSHLFLPEAPRANAKRGRPRQKSTSPRKNKPKTSHKPPRGGQSAIPHEMQSFYPLDRSRQRARQDSRQQLPSRSDFPQIHDTQPQAYNPMQQRSMLDGSFGRNKGEGYSMAQPSTSAKSPSLNTPFGNGNDQNIAQSESSLNTYQAGREIETTQNLNMPAFTQAQFNDTSAYVQQLTNSNMQDVERLQRQRILSLTQVLHPSLGDASFQQRTQDLLDRSQISSGIAQTFNQQGVRRVMEMAIRGNLSDEKTVIRDEKQIEEP